MRLAATLAAAALASPPGPPHVMLGAVGQTRQEVLEREHESAHHLQGVRVFRRWDETLLDADQRWARDTGHTIFLSVKSRRADGSLIAWRDIAAGALDADLRRQARQIRDFGALVYLVFNHEPDAKTSAPMGGPRDFVAAWRHLVSTYRAEGVRNARYVWTMTGDAFARGVPADRYYPGDAYVDDIAADTYNWYTCRGRGSWKSLAELIEPQRRFGLRHPGKGLMLLEWGSAEDPASPGRKARWIRDAAGLFTHPAYRPYRAILHWDDRHTGLLARTSCEFDYRSSPSALAAWRSLAAGPIFAAPAVLAPRWSSGEPVATLLPIVAGVAWLIAFRIYRLRREPPRSPTIHR
jgi:hypothetical protein